MAVTGQTVRDALNAVGAVGGQMRSFDDLAAGLNDALRQAPAGLTGVGAAAFAATQAQESAYFRVTEEYAKNGRYAPHIGRTFEMVTWDSNYLKFGQWCKARGIIKNSERQFVDDPKWLADYRWAWLGGVWFFEANGLWKYANAGNFRAVSQAVNGGNGTIGTSFTPNGMAARQKMYDAFCRAGNVLLPGGAQAAPAARPTAQAAGAASLPDLVYGMKQNSGVASLQKFLNAYGWRPALPILPPTGNYLDQTVSVLRSAQRQMGITSGDGRNVGPQTKQALWDRGWRC